MKPMLYEVHRSAASAQGLPEAGSSLLCGFRTQCRVGADVAQLPSQLQTGQLIKHSLNDTAECCWPNVLAQPSGRPAFPNPGADHTLDRSNESGVQGRENRTQLGSGASRLRGAGIKGTIGSAHCPHYFHARMACICSTHLPSQAVPPLCSLPEGRHTAGSTLGDRDTELQF